MSDDALFLVLMGLISTVFVWAVRRGGPVPKRTLLAFLVASAVLDGSTGGHSGTCGGSGGGHG